MTEFLLDAYLFACPEPDEDVSAAENFINAILEWYEARDWEWFRTVVSTSTYDVLSNAGYYPAWERLQAVFKAHNIYNVSVKDVGDLVTSLLSKSQVLEDKGQVDVVVSSLDCDATSVLMPRPTVFADELERLMAVAIVRHELRVSNLQDQVLVTRGMTVEGLTTDVNAIVDFDAAVPAARTELDVTITGRVALCCCLKGLYSNLSPSRLWVTATDEEDYNHALMMAIFHREPAKVLEKDQRESLAWSFGRKFIDSVKALGFGHEEDKVDRLLRAMVDTILDENLNHTHALRTGVGGNNPQVKRDEDKAWRRDIDYQFHLHYWETSVSPEFAAVVVHNDMSIPA